ncbi:MAG: aldo/keto reductase [Bacteroidia bacterium]|jgi:aryl-alcohol dehydrogenase-like predicted oxidoreductase
MKQKLILGTVQFGLNYGINNLTGKPDSDAVTEILDSAFANGINSLDTADVYGDAIQQIGAYHRSHAHTFKILSKFKGARPGELEGLAEASLHKLHILCFEVYAYHSMADYLGQPFLKKELEALKAKGLIRKIGISVYTNEELEQVAMDPVIDVIQLPFNLLDNMNQRGKYIAIARKNGKEIHTRSAFLQGLFFMHEASIPEKLHPLKPYLQTLQTLCKEESTAMLTAALSYAVCNDQIDHVLIGVDTKDQLIHNLAAIQCNNHFSQRVDQQIHVSETALLNPTNWK